MQSQTMKIVLAVIITAVVASSGTYYFLSTKKMESPKSSVVSQKQEKAVFNKSSKEYAVMSREFWSAIECSTWASHFDDQNEAERLFTFGYEQGKQFLGAVRAEKISEEDWRTEIPMGISMQLAGPSDDFILGVISSSIQDDALEEVFYTNYDKTKLNSDDLQKSIAENKYRDGNCQLIGK
jgi:hypothetical protein